ncbi:hypothetical protein DSECCO2_584540 [anaerobic digester metagenome]
MAGFCHGLHILSAAREFCQSDRTGGGGDRHQAAQPSLARALVWEQRERPCPALVAHPFQHRSEPGCNQQGGASQGDL